MASRPTYVLVCDLCGEVFVPPVAFADEMKMTREMTVPRMLSEVRAAARAVGWTMEYRTPQPPGSMAYAHDECAECHRIVNEPRTAPVADDAQGATHGI